MKSYKILSTRFKNTFKDVSVADEGGEITEDHKKTKEIISEACKRDNVLFLLAAGASKITKNKNENADAPLMTDIFSKIKNLNTYPQVRELVSYDEKNNDFELLLSKCIFYLKIKDNKVIQTFLEESKKIISSSCDFITDEHDLSIAEVFLRKLCSQRGSKNRPSIYSLNYDFLIEKTAAKLGVVLLDGFSFNYPFRFNPIYFDYDIVKREDGSDILIDNAIRFFKIHGSLNWSLKNGAILKNHSKVDSPHIIFPSKEKFQSSYDQPFIEMISRLKDSLRKKSTTLFVVGYSCGDEHINSIIESSLSVNFDLKVVFVNFKFDDRLSVFTKYIEELEDSRVTCMEIDFADFCKALIPEGRSVSKEERLIKALIDIQGIKKNE